jgi:hypothetical protein
VFRSQTPTWRGLNRIFEPFADALETAQGEWLSSVAAEIGRLSVAHVLERARAGAAVRAHATGLRNFWVADPDVLSPGSTTHGRAARTPTSARSSTRRSDHSSRAAGRIFFAGCHTSRDYQGT